MRRPLFAIAACAALCSCRSAPPRAGAEPAVTEGQLGAAVHLAPGPDGAAALRFVLPAPGALVVTASPASAGVHLLVRDADGAAAGQGSSPLRTRELTAGEAIVELSGARADALEVVALFDPKDPDGASHASPASAKRLPLGGAWADGTVDYSAMKRTAFWRIAVPAPGAVSVRFEPRGDGISAELVDGTGHRQRLAADAATLKEGLPAGDVFVRVFANGPGDGGAYRLSAAFRTQEPCSRGGPTCSLEGAEELKLPADSRTGTVDSAGRHFHFYRLTLREKGRLEVRFERKSRGRASAFAMRTPDEEGERIASTGALEVEPGELWIRVQAGPAGPAQYVLTTKFTAGH